MWLVAAVLETQLPKLGRWLGKKETKGRMKKWGVLRGSDRNDQVWTGDRWDAEKVTDSSDIPELEVDGCSGMNNGLRRSRAQGDAVNVTIWKKSLCRCDYVKDLEMWGSWIIQMGPKSNDKGLPWRSSGQDSTFSLQGARVQFLVKEIRSHLCLGMEKYINKWNDNHLYKKERKEAPRKTQRGEGKVLCRPRQRRGDAAPGQGTPGSIEAGRDHGGCFPGAFRGHTALWTPWFWTAGLQNCEGRHFCCLEPPDLW